MLFRKRVKLGIFASASILILALSFQNCSRSLHGTDFDIASDSSVDVSEAPYSTSDVIQLTRQFTLAGLLGHFALPNGVPADAKALRLIIKINRQNSSVSASSSYISKSGQETALCGSLASTLDFANIADLIDKTKFAPGVTYSFADLDYLVGGDLIYALADGTSRVSHLAPIGQNFGGLAYGWENLEPLIIGQAYAECSGGPSTAYSASDVVRVIREYQADPNIFNATILPSGIPAGVGAFRTVIDIDRQHQTLSASSYFIKYTGLAGTEVISTNCASVSSVGLTYSSFTGEMANANLVPGASYNMNALDVPINGFMTYVLGDGTTRYFNFVSPRAGVLNLNGGGEGLTAEVFMSVIPRCN
jgi:hypothetical protein